MVCGWCVRVVLPLHALTTIQFDRRTIAMNKLVAACMGGHVVVWDLRTQHPQHGFASTEYAVQPSATLFACAHTPHNRYVYVDGVCWCVAMYWCVVTERS